MSLKKTIKNFFSNNTRRNDSWSEKADSSDKTYINEIKPNINIYQIYINPNIYLCHRGARVCVGKLPIDSSYIDRIEHVGKVIGYNHESVMEHTNAIAIMDIDIHSISTASGIQYYSDFVSNLKYLNVVSSTIRNHQYLLIGGSARAWIHLVRETMTKHKKDNPFIEKVLEFMYASFEWPFFKPLIKLGLAEENKCVYMCNADVYNEKVPVTQVKSKFESNLNDDRNDEAVSINIDDPIEKYKEYSDLVFASPVQTIYDRVKEFGFTKKDVYKVATLSFIFHNISRSCANQITRHRNGISQESQRYVTHDYTKDDFVNPILMADEDRYSPELKYSVTSHLQQSDPFQTYKYLLSNGIFKEDARAWLPMNVVTQLMMTFTYENFGKFLELRCDKAAQKEVRRLAFEAASHIMDKDHIKNFIKDTCDLSDPSSTSFDGMYLTENDVDDVLSKNVEDMKGLDINSVTDAETLIKRSEYYKSLEKEEKE